MKTKHLFTAAIAVIMAASLTTAVWAQQTAADIPPGIAIPDEMDTRLGKLTFVDGAPSDDTVEKVFDHLDFTRAYDAYLNGYQAEMVAEWPMHRRLWNNAIAMLGPVL